MQPPANPKIYHILHWDRLPSIIADGCLWSDAEVRARGCAGTTIGLSDIKRRRLEELQLQSHPALFVGQCVPFYFCPRSVMLYILHRGNKEELTYHDGQRPIIHLQADLHHVVQWANDNGRRWAFTDGNAGARHFQDFSDLADLGKLNWAAIRATYWQECRDQKQAEFLIEHSFPWELVEFIGVYDQRIGEKVMRALASATHKPPVQVRRGWYY